MERDRDDEIDVRAYAWADQLDARGAGPSQPFPSYPLPGMSGPRRRTSSAAIPPAMPAPTQPIPKLPPANSPNVDSRDDSYISSASYQNGAPGSRSGSLPIAVSSPSNIRTVQASSSNFTAQARRGSPSLPYSRSPAPSTSAVDDGQTSSAASTVRRGQYYQENVPDRNTLAPPGAHYSSAQQKPSGRPSSRRALTRALELAREAVDLDSNSNDPYAAVEAYGRSVALLSEVMERVRRGEDSTESGRRRSSKKGNTGAQEEEIRRLKSIHDTYADRMNILSLIYNIAPTPHSPTAVFNSPPTMTTRAPSPTSGASTDEDATDPIPRTPLYITEHFQQTAHHFMEGAPVIEASKSTHHADLEAIGSAMFGLESPSTIGSQRRGSDASDAHFHPYAATSNDGEPSRRPANSVLLPHMPRRQGSSAETIPTTAASRGSSFARRISNAVPPLAPPPSGLPPPAPSREPSTVDVNYRGEDNDTARLPPSIGATRLDPSRDEKPVFLSHPFSEDASSAANRPSVVTQSLSFLDTAISPTSAVPRSATLKAPPPPLNLKSSGLIDTSPGTPSPIVREPLISPSPHNGSISQRRTKTGSTKTSPVDLPASPPTPAKPAPLASGARARSSSQPGRRPDLSVTDTSPTDGRPPLPRNNSNFGLKPTLNNKSNLALNVTPHLVIQTEVANTSISQFGLPVAINAPMTPVSPLPPAPPSDTMRKPYYMMHLVRTTMISKTGGYLTRRLHVPQEVWSQGGAKLTNVLEKVRVIEVLCSALEDLLAFSVENFGPGSLSNGLSLGAGQTGKRSADGWNAKLEEFSSVCDGVVANFGKKLNVGEGFVLKKHSGVTSWGGKLTRQFDKLTNQKSLDSPAAYVAGLAKLFQHAQLLDEHTKAILSQPMAPLYAAFPSETRLSAEVKLKRSSEFFAAVVLTFVVRDLAQLLDKYSKRCASWINE